VVGLTGYGTGQCQGESVDPAPAAMDASDYPETAAGASHGAGDAETELVPPATAVAPEHAWSNEEPITLTLPRPWRSVWTIAGIGLLCTVIVACAIVGAVAMLRENHGVKPALPATAHSASVPAPASSPAPRSATSSPTDVAGAVAVAQEKADRYSSGDFAGEWLLYTKDLRDNITQASYVEYSQRCSAPAKSRAGLRVLVTGSRLDNPGRAIIRYEVLGVTKSATMIYENGGWYKEPDEFLQSNYAKTASELIAADKAAGNCP
jgi:hypothetical protein